MSSKSPTINCWRKVLIECLKEKEYLDSCLKSDESHNNCLATMGTFCKLFFCNEMGLHSNVVSVCEWCRLDLVTNLNYCNF
jgi:hypothetical protein